MQTISSQLDQAFRAAIQAAFGIDADPLIGVAQNEKFGDYQSNAAMGLAKQLSEKTGQKTNPRTVAEQIKAKLNLGEMALPVTIAGPGFINVTLAPEWLAKQLVAIGADNRLGIDKTTAPKRVVVDYSGPNIAKQMHVGHLRSTIIGDAIGRTLDFIGHAIIRQNHLGDWGTQFGRVVLAMWYEAIFERTGKHDQLRELMTEQQAAARQLAEDGDKLKFQKAIDAIVQKIVPVHQHAIDTDPDGTKLFQPYLNEDALQLDELEAAYVFVSSLIDAPAAKSAIIVHQKYGQRALADLPRLITTFIQNPEAEENEQEKLAWEKAREITLAACRNVYERLGVKLTDADVRGESSYREDLAGVVDALRSKGLAVESEGATVVNVPGFESPLIIQKKSEGDVAGGYLYGTTDLAALRYRVDQLGAREIIYFVDARQSQHFAQVFWTAREAGWADNVELEHAAFGTMLGADGRPFKTRNGDVVKLKDLLDEADQRADAIIAQKNPDLTNEKRAQIAHSIGVGAVKYSDLSKDRVSDYLFDWERMLSFDGNTAPYLQNAFVRVHGIFRKAAERGISGRGDITAVKLESPYELALVKQILRLGEMIELVARELKPHYLCTYLYDLATRFHSFFEQCPVLQSEGATREGRLALCELTQRTLGLGLDLLGIEHPEQM